MSLLRLYTTDYMLLYSTSFNVKQFNIVPGFVKCFRLGFTSSKLKQAAELDWVFLGEMETGAAAPMAASISDNDVC